MKTANFSIVGDIKTKGRPRATVINGHARVYPPEETIIYENYIKSEYQRQCPDICYGDSPIRITIVAFFKPSEELKKTEGYELTYCDKHKDLDNIAKTVLDALQSGGLAFNDDKQVVRLEVEKKWATGEQELLRVVIEEAKWIYMPKHKLPKCAKIRKIDARISELEKSGKKADLKKAEEKKAERDALEKEVGSGILSWYKDYLERMGRQW